LTIYRSINALAESFNGLYKTELIHRRGPWKNVDYVEWATLTYVDRFNNRRIHNEIGKNPPAEFEENYYRQIATSELVSSQTNESA
jgi:putative transposase